MNLLSSAHSQTSLGCITRLTKQLQQFGMNRVQALIRKLRLIRLGYGGKLSSCAW